VEGNVITLVREKGQRTPDVRGGLRRRALVAAGVFFVLVLILHRPVLLYLGRQIAVRAAAKQNLKLVLEFQGNIFTNLTARDVHAVATGPSDIESIDISSVRIDYSLFGLMRHGVSQFVRNVEVRSATIVLNPAKTPPKPRPKKEGKAELPSIFPERMRLTNATVIVRDQPHDLVIQHIDLDLNPRAPGELKIEKVQLAQGQSWSNLVARTSYTNRNLIIQDLALSDSDRIQTLNIDASHIREKRLSLNVDASIGGGRITTAATMNETRTSLNTKLNLVAEKIPADAFNKYLDLPEGFLRGDVVRVVVGLNGVLDAPRSWNATLNAEINNFHSGQFGFDHCVLDLIARDGKAALHSADIVQAGNEFHLKGSAELPNQLNDFGRSPATLEISGKAPDLRPVTAPFGQEIAGTAEFNGKIDIHQGKLEANFNFAAGPLKFADGAVEKIASQLQITKTMPPATAKASWFTNLESKITVDASNIRLRDYMIDSASGSFSGTNDVLGVDHLDIWRKQNVLSIAGQYVLPADFQKLSRTGTVQFSLNAPEVADFWVPDARDRWSGPLQGAGQIEWKNGTGNGALSLSGTDLKTRDLVVKQISAQCAIANNIIYVNDLSANLNEQDFVRGNGIVDLAGRSSYSGKLSANISDLSKLQPLLRAANNQNALGGSLAIDWEGTGEVTHFKNDGKLKIVFDKGRYGTLQSLQANVDATYSPEGLDVPTIFFRSDRMDFQAIVQAKGDSLEITKIQLDQQQSAAPSKDHRRDADATKKQAAETSKNAPAERGGYNARQSQNAPTKYASGYVSIPFVWKNLGTDAPVIPNTGKVIATFQSENIDIKKVFEDFGLAPAVAGTLNVKLEAGGTISDLNAGFDLEIRDLRNEKLPKLEPATFNFSAKAQHGQLAISGKLQQAKIQPLEMSANFPLDVPRIAREGRLPDDTPVAAKLNLPRSSVNFIHELIPAVEQLDGDIAVDVEARGTVANPVLKGQANMTVNVARSNDPTLPALQNFKARLNFADNALTLDQFGGELSGGKFTLTGRVLFPKLTTAELDLKLKANGALIARNDALTVRTDADVQFAGPISSVSVTGNVSLTNSQVLQNLDLIPIGLPGRPAPQPPESHPQLSFPQPPIRDWKFDVAIKTKEPVLLRGNLATGGAVADLHLTGTGLQPRLDGIVRMEKVEATLPFSRLEISHGFLYFNPDDPLNPKLDLHGTSVIRDYTVHVFIYGTALAPEAVFNSEPPLPQEEIISLLATGTTREELTGNNNVLAGRAAMLLVQQLYRKVFKKGQGAQSTSVFDRLDLDVGTVDPRTGQQQAIARFRINDQFVVIGDLGVGGDYRGMLKYLIRFH
jgi:autotransporter translocation and assembly factor TamB